MSRTDERPGDEPARGRIPSDDRLALRVKQVCEAVGAFIEYWGFKAIHGRIWTLLALSTRPLTQVQIADFLDVSRALVSGAVAELMEHGLIRPLDDRRNAQFEAVVDIWPTISDVLREREWMLVEAARVALEGAIEEAELAPERPHRFAIERMRFLLRMTELAQAFLRLLIGMRVPRKLEGIGGWLKDTAKFIRGLRSL
jgi:DNA-binding transcriptional regulator GbsR (MarR family)